MICNKAKQLRCIVTSVMIILFWYSYVICKNKNTIKLIKNDLQRPYYSRSHCIEYYLKITFKSIISLTKVINTKPITIHSDILIALFLRCIVTSVMIILFWYSYVICKSKTLSSWLKMTYHIIYGWSCIRRSDITWNTICYSDIVKYFFR
jgi:hypothetical protein